MNHPLNPMTDPSGYPMNHPINLTDNPIGLKSAYLTDGSSDIRIDQIRIAPLEYYNPNIKIANRHQRDSGDQGQLRRTNCESDGC